MLPPYLNLGYIILRAKTTGHTIHYIQRRGHLPLLESYIPRHCHKLVFSVCYPKWSLIFAGVGYPAITCLLCARKEEASVLKIQNAGSQSRLGSLSVSD